MKLLVLSYLSIGFILVGWRLEIIEEGKRNNIKANGFSYLKAIAWILFWIIPAIFAAAPFVLIFLKGICRKMRFCKKNNGGGDDAWMPQARHL